MSQRKPCTWTYSIQQLKCHCEYSIFLHEHLQSPKKVVLKKAITQNFLVLTDINIEPYTNQRQRMKKSIFSTPL